MKFSGSLVAMLFGLLAAHAEEPSIFDVGGLKFARPADWKWVDVSSPMRKAQLKVPGASAEQGADVTFFHFGSGGGGDVPANVQRWIGQFKAAENAGKIETQEIHGTKVTLVTTGGTFSSGMPGGPTTALENYALLGAIIEGPEGNVFVKMTGPTDLIKASRGKFMDFITAAIPAKK